MENLPMTSVKSLLRTFWFQLLVSSLAKYNMMFIYVIVAVGVEKQAKARVLWIDSSDLYKCTESLDFSVRSNKLVVRKTLRLRPHLGNTIGLAASSCTVWQEVVGHRSGIENRPTFYIRRSNAD